MIQPVTFLRSALLFGILLLGHVALAQTQVRITQVKRAAEARLLSILDEQQRAMVQEDNEALSEGWSNRNPKATANDAWWKSRHASAASFSDLYQLDFDADGRTEWLFVTVRGFKTATLTVFVAEAGECKVLQEMELPCNHTPLEVTIRSLTNDDQLQLVVRSDVSSTVFPSAALRIFHFHGGGLIESMCLVEGFEGVYKKEHRSIDLVPASKTQPEIRVNTSVSLENHKPGEESDENGKEQWTFDPASGTYLSPQGKPTHEESFITWRN